MDIRDSQRIKEIRDNTRAMAEAFSSIASTLADALELYISTRTETQTETQNSNLTFEKRTMRDCYNCKRYETEGECVECHYEPKDEPQTGEIMTEEEFDSMLARVLTGNAEPQTDCAWK